MRVRGGVWLLGCDVMREVEVAGALSDVRVDVAGVSEQAQLPAGPSSASAEGEHGWGAGDGRGGGWSGEERGEGARQGWRGVFRPAASGGWRRRRDGKWGAWDV